MTPKTQSILSYVGLFWLIAFIAEKNERNHLSRYHLKQGLGLLIVGLIFNFILGISLVIFPSLPPVNSMCSIGLLILMVIGIINAANDVKRPIFVIGELFEDKFNFIDE